MVSIKTIISASALAFAGVNAHMILDQPPPYGNPNNSPLDGTGSDFPCKSTSNQGGKVTEMAVGSKQQMSFKGSAVHGGGSCQIALTTDNPATKTSKWQVIKSFEGGCPAKNAQANLPETPGDAAPAPDKFDYEIPSSFKQGTYTLGWTWFNKIGNREMYMNCANVKLTGGSSKRDNVYDNGTYAVSALSERDESFPDLFKANIGNGCKTADSMDLQFPDPGPNNEKLGQGQMAPPTGSCAGGSSGTSGTAGGASGGAGGASGGSGAGQAGAGSPSSQSASPATGGVDVETSPSAGSSGASASGSSSSGATSGSSSAGGASSGQSGSSGSSSVAQTSPAGASSQGGSSSGGSESGGSAGSASPSNAASPQASGGSTAAAPATAAGGQSGSCSSPGQLVCSPDGKQFGTCGQDNKVVMMAVAQGTVCKDGQITFADGGPQQAQAAPQQKRSRIFANGKVRRSFSPGYHWGF